MVFLLLQLLLLLLLLPTSRLHVFNGLPLSGLAEFVTLFLILPLYANSALRRLYARSLAYSPGRRRLPLVTAVLLLAIATKLLLLMGGDRSGFAACYRPADPNLASLTCERSYENPFFRGGVTRVDDTITFGPATWNLSFFNSIRFNYYPWVKGNIERTRLPFAARWHGEIDRPAPATITITYVGEGTARVGSAEAIALPPAYREPATITLTAPAGRHAFALDYRFDDGSRVGDGSRLVRGPYGRIDVRADGTPLRTIDPPVIWRAAGGLVDLTIVVFLASVVSCYFRLLRRDIALAALACIGGALLAVDPTVTMRPVEYLGTIIPEIPRGLPRGIGLTLVTSALFVPILSRPSTRRLLLAFLAIGWASAFRRDFFLHGFHAVLYRGPGGDWLTYESFARSILETGSLEAGEPIFFYQPFFRYIVFLSHALLGDGDTSIAFLAQALLIWSIFWMSARLLPRGLTDGTSRRIGIAIGLLLIALATSDPVSWMIHEGASEYPTWIAFLVLFPCLLASTSMRDWWLGVTMIGFSLITRTNLAIGLGWIYALFLVRVTRVARLARGRMAFAIQSLVLLAAFAALPVAHNAWYGRALSVLPAEHDLAATLPMPPSRWLRVFHDEGARTQALKQFTAVTYARRIAGSMVLTQESHVVMSMVCRGLQVAWIAAGILLLTIRSPSSATLLTARLAWILPVLYLSVHLFYQAVDGHPRFIVIGYFAMGAVAMLALRERATMDSSTCPSSPRLVSSASTSPATIILASPTR